MLKEFATELQMFSQMSVASLCRIVGSIVD
jgi:hypothetical protein